jgi:hypothetical protein
MREQVEYQIVQSTYGSSYMHDDNSKEMQITIRSGTKSTGGYSIAIEKVEYDTDSNQIHVYAIDKSPEHDSCVTDALEEPKLTIKVPKRNSSTIMHVVHWRHV